MRTPRLTGMLTIALCGTGLSWAQTTHPRAGTHPKPIRARPAVLILRASGPAAVEGTGPRFDVVEPRGFARLPFGSDGTLPLTDDGVPDLGTGFQFARRCVLAADSQEAHYYIYHVDLADSGTVRNWESFQRAQRRQRRQARAAELNDRAWEHRKQQLLAAAEQAVQEGVAWLRAGQYREALISLTRAGELDQGDPVCRIHLVQARVALGHDIEAAAVLRRALELQPKLVPLRLGLEQYYPHEEDLPIQVDGLTRRVGDSAPAAASEYFLVGFMTFQCGWYDEAYAAFQQAAKQDPKDALTQSYLDITKPSRTGR